MKPDRSSDISRDAVLAIAATLLFCWHLPLEAQGCESLDTVRDSAQRNFSKITGRKLEDDGQYLSLLTLPNAQRCVIDIYSKTEAKYSCEWVVARDSSAEASVRAIFDDFVSDLSQCANSKNEVARGKRKTGRGEWAYFPDSRYPNKDVNARLRLEYTYFSPWWLMELAYDVGGEK